MEAPPESRHEAGAAAIAALTNWRRSIAEDITIPLVFRRSLRRHRTDLLAVGRGPELKLDRSAAHQP